MTGPSNFLDSDSTKNGLRDLFMAVLSLMSMAYVGFNRFSVIPLIVALSAALADLCGWWTWNGGIRASNASVFFTYAGYYTGELFLVMYGYFIVEKILPAGSGAGSLYGGIIGRKMFMFIFWPLQLANLGLRVASMTYATVSWARTHHNSPPQGIYDLTQAMFILLCVIETFTAYLLVVIFHRSRGISLRFLGGNRLSLFKHMILSTEIRVASLAILYITRAACEQPKRHHPTANRIDGVALNLIVYFPVLLVLDCILRKAINTEVDLQARIEKCTCLERGNTGDSGSNGSCPRRETSPQEAQRKRPSRVEVAGAFGVE